jgi:hypothetical protein
MFKLTCALLLVLVCLTGDASFAQVAGEIVVYPIDSSIEIGSSRTFSAYVPISPNTITWSVNDIVGGNATVGTITQKGVYKPPTVAPTPNTVIVKATSKAFPTHFGAATLKVTRKHPMAVERVPESHQSG